MAQIEWRQPTKVYRGTVEEVFSHRGEIPPDAILELKVFEENAIPGDNEEIFSGRSVLEVFPDLFGTELGEPEDMSEHPSKYMKDFGKTDKFRTLAP